MQIPNLKFAEIKGQTHLSYGLVPPPDDTVLKYVPWVAKAVAKSTILGGVWSTQHGRTYVCSQAAPDEAPGSIRWQSRTVGPAYWGKPGIEYGRILLMTPCFTDRLFTDGVGANQDQALQQRMILEQRWVELSKFVFVFAYKLDVLEHGSMKPMGSRLLIVGRDSNGGAAAGYAYAMNWIVQDSPHKSGVRHMRAPDMPNFDGLGRCLKIHTN